LKEMKIDGMTLAHVLKRFGPAENAFELMEIPVPDLLDDEVLIESEAFGLNYADVMARKGKYPEMPPMPCVIGYEVVGKVVKVGAHVDPKWLGTRVLAFCRFGGYAQHVKTKEYALASIQEIPSEVAMALCTQAVTAYYMAHYVTNIHRGDRVLIHAAAGGVGTMLIQLAHNAGAIVFAKIGDEKKRETVRSLGADFIINYKETDYLQQLKKCLGTNRLDISFNPAAGASMRKDWQLLGSGGRLVLFGASELSSKKLGILSKLNFARKMGLLMPIEFMMRSKSIIGVNMLKIADHRPDVMKECLNEVLSLFVENKLHPQVGGVYPFEQLNKAHTDLEGGKTIGKLTVKW
jgi:NADPH:quinone reductase-like Zn-dependent oxidoreductase